MKVPTYEYLDGLQLPKKLYDDLRERVANDLGFESIDAVYESDGGEDLEIDERMEAFIIKGIQRELGN